MCHSMPTTGWPHRLLFAAAHAGLVPGIICLVSVPLILYVIYPPEVKDTPDAPAKARRAFSPHFLAPRQLLVGCLCAVADAG